MTFKDKIDLMFVIVHTGNSQKLVDFRRPIKIELDFPDGTSKTIDLEDVHKLQLVRVSRRTASTRW